MKFSVYLRNTLSFAYYNLTSAKGPIRLILSEKKRGGMRRTKDNSEMPGMIASGSNRSQRKPLLGSGPAPVAVLPGMAPVPAAANPAAMAAMMAKMQENMKKMQENPQMQEMMKKMQANMANNPMMQKMIEQQKENMQKLMAAQQAKKD
jgi:hypothetical protein